MGIAAPSFSVRFFFGGGGEPGFYNYPGRQWGWEDKVWKWIAMCPSWPFPKSRCESRFQYLLILLLTND